MSNDLEVVAITLGKQFGSSAEQLTIPLTPQQTLPYAFGVLSTTVMDLAGPIAQCKLKF